MERSPRKGELVVDQLGNENRSGFVVGSSFIQGELFIKVRFNSQKIWEEPEELEYGSCFTKHNGGWGRWDENKQAWMIEKSGDELPEDDPFVVSFNENIRKFNIELLLKRISSDVDLNIIQIDILAVDYRNTANDCGIYSSYKSGYEAKAKDYEDYRYYRLHGKLPE